MAEQDVAVTGYACRVPGAARVDDLWEIVAGGRDVVTRATANIGATSGDRVHAYGVLDGYELFDEDFFGYSPREAAEIDPQQRLLLECAVEALESAGIRLAGLHHEVGAYLSVGLSGYLLATWTGGSGGADTLPTLLGGDGHYAASRVAYKLGLTGPAVALGSACSSSLLAIHVAAQAIRNGECDVALAGGMDVEFPQPMSYLYQEGGILARDGVCRPFDLDATGTVFGSGGGVVVLALPEVALERGWPVKAVLLGSAANNDGAEKVSFTAPRGSRQRDVIQRALTIAGKSPDEIGYVECHGTGTRLGDGTEFAALRQVFGPVVPPVGSLKGNVGHLRVGAGVVSFIKACEVVRRGVVPPAANLDHPADPAAALAQAMPLRAGVVGVSSFGFGGTNVHTVLGRADPGLGEPRSTVEKYPLVAKVSSAGPESCLAMARGLAEHLEALPGVTVTDLAHTLEVGRDDRPYRYAVVGADRATVVAGLAAPDEHVIEGWAGEPSALVLALPGQGEQVVPRLAAFYRWEDVFTESADRLWSLVRGLETGTGTLDDVIAAPESLTRPAAHALRVITDLALVDQLRDRGVSPGFVAGYSIGEYTAAAATGAMAAPDVVRLVVERARLLDSAPPGDMIVVQATRQQLGDLDPVITLSRERHVLAVLAQDLASVRHQLTSAGIAHRELGVGVPYHSEALAEQADRLAAVAASYDYPGSDSLVLTARSDLPLGGKYWSSHLCGPVDFTKAGSLVGAMHQVAPCAVVDLSADGSLSRAIRSVSDAEVPAVRLFDGARDPRRTYLEGLSALWVQGHPVRLGSGHGRLISLPPRSFDRRRHLKEVASNGHRATAGKRSIRRESSVEKWAYHPSWRLRRRPPVSRSIAGERWLIFAGADDEVVRRLEDLGVECVHVRPDVVRAGDKRSVQAMITGLGLDERPISRLVHMWCMAGRTDAATLHGRLAAVDDELAMGFYTLLYAIQEISVRQGATPLQLDIVTRGIHPLEATRDTIIPERSLLAGPALVVPQDLPFVSARTIDVTGLPGPELAEEILAELRCDPVDRAVTFGGGNRWVRGYEPDALPTLDSGRRPLRLRERGVYLITGGLGGIGMTLAEYLVRTCRARLILTALEAVPDAAYWEGGRDDLPDDPLLAERVTRLRKLVRMGGEILAVRCDAASHDETAALFTQIDRRFGQLHGAVHAAGVFETQRAFRGLEDTGAEDCTRRLRPKVDGTIVLAECLRGRKLDFVLMQSSLSAQLGGLGFYAYTAGNAYMDAFAECHRDDDIPWMSVNWDGWIFRERADDARHESVVSPSFASPDFGVVAEIAVRPSEGAEIYGRLMNLARPRQVLISTADLADRYEQWVTQPLPRPDERSGPMVAPTGPPRGDFADEVEAAVASVWHEVLGVENVGRSSNFFALGGDSLLGVTLAFRLGQVFGVVLSVITMFDRPTVEAMSEEIRRLGGRIRKLQEVEA